MKTFLLIDRRMMPLEGFLSRARSIVTLGRASEEAYNVVALEDEAVDLFQCQFVHTEEGWRVQNGQWRTECPKGIRSRLQHACNLCMGRCVNSRPAHPTYSWRMPAKPTLLNGAELGKEGAILHEGDALTVGQTTVHVVEAE